MLLAAVAVCTDMRWRRIPNGLTVPALIAGIIFNVWAHGATDGSSVALKGLAVGLVLLLPLFMLGGMGGGDVKLIACIGAWVGPLRILSIVSYGAMICAGVCLVIMMRSEGLSTLKRVGADVRLLLMTRTRLEPRTDVRTIPYSLPIVAGVVLADFLGDLL
jgi:prepilin peptidase CpaA